MKAIHTKYIPATNTRGSRIAATTGEKGQRVVISYDSALNSDDAHSLAARTLRDKMNWRGAMTGGYIVGIGYVWTFNDSPDKIPADIA